MPILAREDDIHPLDLLTRGDTESTSGSGWFAFYLLSRREKEFMRRLRGMNIAHYCPMIAKRYRSPSGRFRTSFLPLFPGYVFVFANDEERYRALTTNCVSRWLPVADGKQLTADLRQIHRLIQHGAALTPESRLEAGDPVRIRTGPFANLEGTIVKRHGQSRLVIAVRFLQQGASILLEDCEVEAM